MQHVWKMATISSSCDLVHTSQSLFLQPEKQWWEEKKKKKPMNPENEPVFCSDWSWNAIWAHRCRKAQRLEADVTGPVSWNIHCAAGKSEELICTLITDHMGLSPAHTPVELSDDGRGPCSSVWACSWRFIGLVIAQRLSWWPTGFIIKGDGLWFAPVNSCGSNAHRHTGFTGWTQISFWTSLFKVSIPCWIMISITLHYFSKLLTVVAVFYVFHVETEPFTTGITPND